MPVAAAEPTTWTATEFVSRFGMKLARTICAVATGSSQTYRQDSLFMPTTLDISRNFTKTVPVKRSVAPQVVRVQRGLDSDATRSDRARYRGWCTVCQIPEELV